MDRPRPRPRRWGWLVLLAAIVIVVTMDRTSTVIRERKSPLSVSVASASPNTINSSFPIGVFEDATMIGGREGRFQALLDDIKARGFDSVLLTNSDVARDARLLDISDRLQMNVIFALNELSKGWWSADVAGDRARAEALVRPAIEKLGIHPSLKGYSIADEPTIDRKEKLATLTDVFHTLDPERPALPILIGLDRVEPLFDAARPRVMLIDVYPIGFKNAVGDLSMTGYGYGSLDFVSYVRAVSRNRPAGTPLWMILQTHSFKDDLRQPVPAEVRLQNWLAIGEGATGLFWFIYSSQQGWVGLHDNASLMDEVTALTAKVAPIRDLLVRSAKVPDVFEVSGDQSPYISTLQHDDGHRFAVVVNRDALRPREVRVTARGETGKLRDLTSGGCRVYELGQPILLQPGDGAVFELLSDEAAPQAYSGGVPRYPVDYSTDVETWWAGHPLNPNGPCHVDPSTIVSPPNVVNVARDFGGDVQAAINALPRGGGTLYFEPGVYRADVKLVGRSNVHFVSDGGAVLRGGPVEIVGCPVALDYGKFNLAFNQRDEAAIRCGTTDRIQNIYFKNLTFDGAGTSIQAVTLSAARDVLFDGITLRNYLDPKEHHRGLISATAMIDNIWIRGSHFVGNERYAVYFDGPQGSGVIGSTIDPSFGSGGLLFMTNDDFSYDLNRNDTWDPGEMRLANYVVVANNTFGADNNNRSVYAAVGYIGANALVTGNVVEGDLEYMVELSNRCSQRWANLPYQHISNRIIGNRARRARALVTVRGETVNCLGVDGTIGRYEVKGNVIELDARLEGVVQETGPVAGPNVVTQNTPLTNTGTWMRR